MNIRIEEQNLRFKITEAELEELLGGHCLHATVVLPGKTLVATINPQGQGDAMEPKLVLDQAEAYLSLLISPARVQELADMGRNRDGLKQETDSLCVSLQVDMRKNR